MSAGEQLLRDANEAMASVRAGRPRYLSVAGAERALRGGLPSNHQPARGIPGWEVLQEASPAFPPSRGVDGPSLEAGRNEFAWKSSTFYRRKADPADREDWSKDDEVTESLKTSPRCDCVAAVEEANPINKGRCYKLDDVWSGKSVWDPTVRCWPHEGACRCLAECGAEHEGGPETPYDVDPESLGCSKAWREEFLLPEFELSPAPAEHAAPGTDDEPCSVWVGGSEVERFGRTIGWHLFVSHFDETGLGILIAGQPDHDRMSLCPVFGHIKMEIKPIRSVPELSILVLRDPAACALRECLKAEALRITSSSICYDLPFPNSNSAAYTILARCGIPTVKPALPTPGWGHLI